MGGRLSREDVMMCYREEEEGGRGRQSDLPALPCPQISSA